MKSSLAQTFLVGRATAELLRERLEAFVQDFLAQAGKTVAQCQEQWQNFEQEVSRRAEVIQTLEVAATPEPSQDLQAVLDDLRAEVAQLRSELQKYRSQGL
ncbi:MAG: hypothetical protein Q6J68_02635 [Thermostichales cyanobacterium SZTDM-1c_bins_54]